MELYVISDVDKDKLKKKIAEQKTYETVGSICSIMMNKEKIYYQVIIWHWDRESWNK